MNLKKLSLFLLPIVVTGAVIGSGYAIWQFADNTPLTQPDASISVEESDQKIFSKVNVWFGEINYSEVNWNDDRITTNNASLIMKKPSFTVDQTNALFSSPMKIRGYLNDPNYETSKLRLTYKIQPKDVFFRYFTLSTKRFKSDGTIENLVYDETQKDLMPGSKIQDADGTYYVEFPYIYVDTSYLPEQVPQSFEQMGKIANEINEEISKTDSLLDINLKIVESK